ncbi:hypothetical protein BY996DRAFT_6856710 [Phakopsora pachyrhizi]|nr:hypothetical protein BY996DRAFT_6856710 [Phakopsora pachyrhizi]
MMITFRTLHFLVAILLLCFTIQVKPCSKFFSYKSTPEGIFNIDCYDINYSNEIIKYKCESLDCRTSLSGITVNGYIAITFEYCTVKNGNIIEHRKVANPLSYELLGNQYKVTFKDPGSDRVKVAQCGYKANQQLAICSYCGRA